MAWTGRRVESTAKRFNTGAEAILQLLAAFLSEDDRLERRLKTLAWSPFRTDKAGKERQAA